MVKNITIIISSKAHPINACIENWMSLRNEDQHIKIVRTPEEATGGDLCFLISCSDIVPLSVRKKYSHVLVIHASDLPKGRGWSPHIWHIIDGGEEVVVSLLEASEKVDRGDIWQQYSYKIPKYFLYDDIMKTINQAHIDLMDFAVENFTTVKPVPQDPEIEPTYYPKRTPLDSEIFPSKTIAEQFNILRVCDKIRYPAFIRLHGKKFKIMIERYDDE